MYIVLLDGYVDEPSCLGVPPFISPYVRYTAGAIKEAGHEFTYLTIDEYRNNSPKNKALKNAKLLAIIGGAIVPGKYLRGTPASIPEIKNIAENFKGTKILGGPIAKFGFSGDRKIKDLVNIFDFLPKSDPDAFIFDLLSEKSQNDRLRTEKEWRNWAIKGSSVITQHPDFPNPLIIELETYRGCVRFFTGGCSFCIEPLFGEPKFREPKDIIDEVGALNKFGAVNFRLGAQSCIFSYKIEDIGSSETPKPRPEIIEKLLSGVRNAVLNLEVLHTDNANPAVIAEHPNEAKRILKALVKYCTSGNVLALGMESADPKVIAANNLNATPDQVLKAIELINEYGAKRGENGMPKLLPGINFLSGLSGESKRTFEHNFKFLKDILERDLLLRRINIRQVAFVRNKFDVKIHHTDFLRFKRMVREEIDINMLKLILPTKTVLKRVFLEKVQGNVTFGRQIGTYPLLVGIPYQTPLNTFKDVIITDHGFRSVTGIEYPLNVNSASLKALSSLPGIGKKRAARIVLARPFSSQQDFLSSLDDEKVANSVLDYISFNR
ncbi:MAG: radical SAM protein [Thermoplasmata archaeon]|nr:MAG: radical SAM protein [Thermoplasmata archaeon]